MLVPAQFMFKPVELLMCFAKHAALAVNVECSIRVLQTLLTIMAS